MPQLLLYTDAAEIDETTLQAMREAGVLPVKVADPDAVKLIPIPIKVETEKMDVIFEAAIEALANNRGSHAAKDFGETLASILHERA